jgi:uncharacterized protein YjiS (DUF1127 family)
MNEDSRQSQQETQMRSFDAFFGSPSSHSRSARAFRVEQTGAWTSIVDIFRRELRRRHDLRHLASMSERDLRDIGLTPDDARRATGGGRWSHFRDFG